MRFEVRNPLGAPHEVELEGTLATIGRDPTCDLVLNDPKCSRRHAVVEAGPDGLTIRDAGSANGIYVNGKKTERSPLYEGDVVRLGDASITVLGEDVPGTLVMGPEDIEQGEQVEVLEVGSGDPADTRPEGLLPIPASVARPAPPRAAPPRPADSVPKAAPRPQVTGSLPPRVGVHAPHMPPPPPGPPVPRGAMPEVPPRSAPPVPRAGSAGPAHASGARASRPFSVSVLAMLWSLSVIVFPLAGFLLARSTSGGRAAAAIVVGLLMAVVSGVMAYGMFAMAAWARVAQIVIAALGTIACFHPFSIASAITLVYMLRAPAKHHFDPAPNAAAPPGDATTETIVAGALLAAVVLGVLVTAALTFLARSAHS